MKTWTRYALPGAALLAVAASGCATGRQATSENPAAERVSESQRQSKEALSTAQKAQEKATEQQKRAATAQADVREAQRRLNEAQQRAQQETMKAEQAQREANLAIQQSTQQAQQAQQQASRQLTQQQRLVSRGEQILGGQVKQATANQVVVQPPSGDPMTFQITNRTRVQIDGQQASAAQITPGEDARVAYEMTGTQPTAVLVQVVTGNPAAPGAASPPASATGTGTGGTGTGTGGTSGTTPPEPTR
ncbi:hypothetical protein [Anaeromyxobacter terrae]|uniref:hypothetical protein n=1 Tax=Anaeromyxobacter terrae TaxID=2925406 RepID=UPI001F570E3B|nr:hypothetical protein [Anaeromyxobacter sp. SG22]